MKTAKEYLSAARIARALGEVQLCVDYAESAYVLAARDVDGETSYHARACLGRLFGYRAEFPEAYDAYRMALTEAEVHRLERWVGPAHLDCYTYAILASMAHEVAAEHARRGMNRAGCGIRLEGGFAGNLDAFMQNWAYLSPAEGAVLHSAATSSTWRASKPHEHFERMVAAGSMAVAAGRHYHQNPHPEYLSHAVRWYDVAEHRFQDARVSDEGAALTMLDLARGAVMLRLGEKFEHWVRLCIQTATIRGEVRVIELARALRAEFTPTPRPGGSTP